MAGEADLFGGLGTEDLSAFQKQMQADSMPRLFGNAIGGMKFDTSRWNPYATAATSFLQGILSGGLGQWAKNDDAEQLHAVQAVLPQLATNPESVTAPEGVDSSAFDILKGSAELRKKQRDALLQAEQTKELSKQGMAQDESGTVSALPGYMDTFTQEEKAKAESKNSAVKNDRLTQATVGQLNDKLKAVEQLNALNDMAGKMEGGDSWFGGALRSGVGAVEPNSNVAAYERMIPAVSDQLAKGYSGTARQFNIQQIQKTLSPSFGESKTSLQNVLESHIGNLLQDAQGQLARLDAAGYDTSGLQSQMEALRKGAYDPDVFRTATTTTTPQQQPATPMSIPDGFVLVPGKMSGNGGQVYTNGSQYWTP